MANPFENPDGRYAVLVNDEGQHSLWPSVNDVPQGWSVALADATREDCTRYVEENWTDLRPKSLREAMKGN